MRPTTRLLARYLEPGTQTGLTGLWTHPTPRSTLLFLYHRTLERLSALPDSSLYRQSVEAVTKHRLALVEKQVPPGYAEWAERVRKTMAERPGQYRLPSGSNDGGFAHTVKYGDKTFVLGKVAPEPDVRVQEWDGEADEGPTLEGIRTPEERADQALIATRKVVDKATTSVELEPEPLLTADQIAELENQIGAGLIEEVIQVAEGELKALDILEQAKVWESLEEQPAEDQWKYFERK
ncbi:NADH-ubiquinone oxidoreductase 29.9 kDa subunit [Ceratocystis lukuohia]|uniref:NADH-ubiquinone oxidoreductase 29.9 kDa subunit mitochondrial n=3 Tax=Ceratocystis TaxID=5157 RepID=A0A0F8BYK0_CERFI|nr:NADH-ubiquinone oxidoreductase 29.9 kDa subunit mitochondrial [Ceratocystis platani]PHH52542.1 NADH-ubiquinone oxidoreductase 29.9 kDa subunit, mitochondrial [Ceratocystis fimbriata CBS 114723]